MYAWWLGTAGVLCGWSPKSASSRARTTSTLKSNNPTARVGNKWKFDKGGMHNIHQAPNPTPFKNKFIILPFPYLPGIQPLSAGEEMYHKREKISSYYLQLYGWMWLRLQDLLSRTNIYRRRCVLYNRSSKPVSRTSVANSAWCVLDKAIPRHLQAYI